MNYILDTDIVSNILNKKSPHRDKILQKMQLYSPRQIYISVFTKCELYFGLERVDKRKNEYRVLLAKSIDNFVTRINVLDLSPEFAQVYARVRAGLVSKGNDIGVIDCMIAAQSITHNFTLVTHNLRHYKRIQNLDGFSKFKLADWV